MGVRKDTVRKMALAMPEATEQESWETPTFRVRKKIFVMYAGGNTHHGREGRDSVWCNAPLGVQEHLVREDPEVYFVPPYVGVSGWIGIVLDRIDDDTLRSHVVESYCMIAPKKLQALVSE